MSTQLAWHCWKPLPHVKPQVAAVHVAAPFTGLGQVMSQSPQWLAELETSRQAPPQSSRPAAQLGWHVPFEQTKPVAQALPHAPQLAGSLFVSLH